MNLIVQSNKLLRGASTLLVQLSCLTLLVIVVLTVTDTTLRYLFNNPISGSNEMVEILLSVLIMLALPYCTINRAHVRVDLLDNALGPLGCKLADLFTGAIAVVVLYFLCERSLRKARDAWEYGDATIYLGFPQWPLYTAICISMAIVGLILIVQMIATLFGVEIDERS